MKPPPIILGAALLFWGWRTDFLSLAAALAILLELPLLFRARWNFADKELNRLWDVCMLLFVGAIVFLRYSEDVSNAAYRFFQWFPLVFYPMAFGYAYGSRDSMPLKTFSWFMRQKGRPGADKPMPFGWMYFGTCLVTSGASNVRDYWFFCGIALLVGWALMAVRPRRIRLAPWIVLFLLLCGTAFVAQNRLQDAQGFLEAKLSELFAHFARRQDNPFASRTAMGRMGALEQSARIVMKVKPERGSVPERLREATYTSLHRDTWRGGGRDFEPVPVEADLTTWTLNTNTVPAASIRIIERVPRKYAFLSVPLGTAQLRNLNANIVETNRYAVIRSRENPGLVDFQARFGPGSPEAAPEVGQARAVDLSIPGEEMEAVEAAAKEIDVENLAPTEQAAAIVGYFASRFRYTTYQDSRTLRGHGISPLSEFLLNTRAGHCEFFASATVLLLRHYGIPARYVIGYAIQEDSRDGDSYVIRERDGHAWANAFINGRWTEVDSTPPDWEKREKDALPFYQPLADAWQNLTFGFLEWRWLGERAFFKSVAPWLLLPLAIFLFWRVFGRKMTRRQKPGAAKRRDQGADSELYLLEKRLKHSGLARQPEETAARWLARVSEEKPVLNDPLKTLLSVHYKYRFDPLGLSPAERETLRSRARECLAQLKR
jgi:transglutaminase-like putative cysteine protease